MEKKKINILIAEDNPADLNLVSEMLKDCAIRPSKILHAGKIEDILKILSEANIDLMLFNLHLLDDQGLLSLEEIVSKYPQLPVILLTGFADEEIGLEAVQKWAADYLAKSQINSDLISRSMQYAIERKQQKKEHEIIIEFLQMVNQKTALEDLVSAAVNFFWEKSGCQAVGLRLKDGQDYPYFEARGFSKEFILLENSLCVKNDEGEVLRDNAGNPVIECMCGNVILGRFDVAKPYFTKRGSFWTNSTSELLVSATDSDWQSRTRNHCNGQGYESVALVALRVGNEKLGLLQFNDRRKGIFTPEMISFWEKLADYLSVALGKMLTEKALRESEERYRCLVDMSPEAVFIARDNKIVFVNQKMLELFAASGQQLLGITLFEIFHPAYHMAMRQRINKLLSGKPMHVLEGKVLRMDNAIVDVEICASVFKDRDGVAIQVLLRNITDRKDAEDKLLQAYLRLNLLVDNSPLAVIEWDNNFHIKRWAGEAQKVFGWTSDEVLGKHIDDLPWIYDNDKKVMQQIKVEMLSKRSSKNVNKKLNIRKDGKIINCEWYNTSLYDKSGSLISVLSQVLDITDRVVAEESLRQSERLYRAIGELMDYGIWVCNSEGKNIYTSENYLKVAGITQQECSDFGWTKSLHPDDVEKTIAAWQECVHKGTLLDIEHRFRGADGE